ncbi:cytochrome c oxidase assembly factor 7B-like [Gigantopelta aegis]|uniref:cytochrome c oxidase assembly factor 7B-like n=1 Tax=Gigantopelta aegis TaxID=1735272 RepID=UPI001B88B263|nr:cytochrome c oxidase assembly factor 7B-like [Gigantopelta aegis]
MSYDFKDEEQVKEYIKNLGTEYRFQCYHEKIPEGCHRLGDFFESIKKDLEKASKVFKTNCDDNNYGWSCFKVANYLLHNKVSAEKKEKNGKEIAQYFVKGCENGYVPSCHLAGLLFSTDKIGPGKDFKKAEHYLQKACDQKYAASCYQLSAMFIRGSEEYPKDMARAFKYSLRSCDMNHMYACSNVSQMYKKGDGVVKNLNLAEKFRKKAKELFEAQKVPEKPIAFSE